MDLDYQQIYNSLRAIVPQGGVFELRLLGTRKGQIDSGYFDDPAQAAHALVSSGAYYKGIYLTSNPVIPEALARSYNRITPWAQHSTHDKEITKRRWLPIDIDPKRPNGISSSDEEHAAALNAAKGIATVLTMLYGFPDPMILDSGNGAWLMYRIDEDNSDEVRDEIHKFLRILKKQYATSPVDIDTTVYNAARISRVPGTWARKGDSTPDRPHRRSEIVKPADAFKLLHLSQVMKYNEVNSDQLKDERLPANGKKQANEYPQDEALYKALNDYALRNVKLWVPHFFNEAREYKEGYRVPSDSIGESFEEELTIHPWPMGIKYFGVADQDDKTEGRRTPVSVIAQYSLRTVDKDLAARKLADHLNYPLTEFGAITDPPPPMQATVAMNGRAAMPVGENFTGTKIKYNFSAIKSIKDLLAQEKQEIKWIIKDVLPTGNMLLAARPKMRKTWLALQLALAIARGRKFLDWQCEQGGVLFLGLEDNERRLQNRIRTLTRMEFDQGDLSQFHYFTGGMDYDGAGRLKMMNPEEYQTYLNTFPRGDAGVDALEQYLELHPYITTVIIDTFQHFRGDRTSRDIYASDYDAMTPITKLANRRKILAIPVFHEKKGNADRGIGGDFLEDVSGSAGITGGSDGVISIKGRRGVQEDNESRKILISGRDVPYDIGVDAAFDADRGGWIKAAKEDTKTAIKDVLRRHGMINQRDIMNLLPTSGQARINRALMELKLEGEIEQGRYGYSIKKEAE